MSSSSRGKRGPAHQNTHAFKHNPHSKKTQLILSIPNQGLCSHCHNIIEWRKKYRKYKPISQPKKCQQCAQKTVIFAYHGVCAACAEKKKICPKCLQHKELFNTSEAESSGTCSMEEAVLVQMMSDAGVRERRKRLILRLWEKGETSSEQLKQLIQQYGEEGGKGSLDDGFSDDDYFDDDDDSEPSVPKPSQVKAVSVSTRSTASSSASALRSGVDRLSIVRPNAPVSQSTTAPQVASVTKHMPADDDDDEDDDDDLEDD